MSKPQAPLLLDTCAVIWAAEDQELSEPARTALDDAYQQGLPVYVSPMSAWEIGLLVSRGRLRLTLKPHLWFQRLLEVPNIRLADMLPDLLIASSFLPGVPPRDPVDRVIAATAREYDFTLMTRDAGLIAYGEEGHLRTLVC
jgi:PIN domain nuclease of toxin-antitoxin system